MRLPKKNFNFVVKRSHLHLHCEPKPPKRTTRVSYGRLLETSTFIISLIEAAANTGYRWQWDFCILLFLRVFPLSFDSSDRMNFSNRTYTNNLKPLHDPNMGSPFQRLFKIWRDQIWVMNIFLRTGLLTISSHFIWSWIWRPICACQLLHINVSFWKSCWLLHLTRNYGVCIAEARDVVYSGFLSGKQRSLVSSIF